MNSISETNSPSLPDSKESKESLDLQDDLKDLFGTISSFIKITSELLSEVPREETGSIAKISSITKVLFGIIAVLTIALNIGLNFVDATPGQMIIANLAISVLYVLVGMCLISDLSKGRTHFQNEREQIQERIQTVSEFLKILLQERAELVNAVCESKWHLENEQVKLQMSKLEVTSQQEKIEYLNSTISDTSSILDEMKRNLIDLESQKEKLLFQKQVVSDELNAAMHEVQTRKAEIDRLTVEVESFKLKEQDAEASLQETNGILEETSIRCEQRQLELVETEEKLGRLAEDVDKRGEHLKQLLDSVLEYEDRLAQRQTDLGQLNAQSAEVEQKVQSSLAREADMTSVCQKLEDEKQTILKSIEEAGLRLTLLENQVSSTTANSVQIEQGIQRLQVENLDLVNQTVALQSHLASQMELVTQCEAHLHAMAEAQKTKEMRVKELDEESELLEERIASFLKHLSDLECLFVAKTMAQYGDKPVNEIEKEQEDSSNSETCEHIQPCPTCAQYQLEAEHRMSIASLVEELETRQLAALDVVDESRQSALEAEKQIADAEKRVEMLSKKAEGLNDQVQERVNELYGLKQDLIAMRSEKRGLESTLEERQRAEGELVELKNSIEAQKSEIEHLRSRLLELDESCAGKSVESKQMEISIADLTWKLNETRAQLDTSQMEIHDLRGTRSELEESCMLLRDAATDSLKTQNDAERELIALRDEIAVESDHLQKLLAEQDTQLKENDRIAQSLMERRDQRAEIELDLGILQQRQKDLQRVEREVENAQYQLDLLVERLLIAEAEVRTREKELLDSETRWNAMQFEVQQLESRIADLERAEEAANQSVNNLRVKEEESIAQYESMLSDVESGRRKLEDLNRELKASESRNAEASSRWQTLADEVKEAEAIARQWQAYIISLQGEIQDSTSRKMSLEKEIESLQSKTESLQSESRAARDLLDAMNAERLAIVDQCKSAEQVLSRVNNELESAEANLSIYLTQQRDARIVLRELESERSELENAIALAVNQWEQEQSKVSDLQNRCHRLEDLIGELQHEKKKYQLQIESLKEESDSLRDSNQESQERLSKLEAEVRSLERMASELEELRGEFNERNSDLHRLEMELDELRNRKHNAEQDVIELEKRQQGLCQVTQEIEIKSVALTKLKNEYDQQRVQLSLLEEQISAREGVKDDLTELEDRLQETDVILKSKEDERLLRESKLQEIDQLIATRDEELNRTTLLLQSKNLEIQEFEDTIATRQEEATGLENRIGQSHKEIRKLAILRSSTEETIAELLQDVDSRREEILLCNQELKTAVESEESMKIQIATLESQIATLRNGKNDLANQSMVTEAQLEAAKAELLAIRSQSTSSAAEAIALERTIQSMQSEIERVNDELQTLKLERESIQQLIETKNTPVQSENLKKVRETTEAEPSRRQEFRDEDAQELKSEADVWSALNELRQLEETVRINSRGFDANPSESRRVTSLDVAARIPKQTIPRPDAWAEILANN